ncbi:MAG TPA: SET domain-containing protein-lysine N-methyltransferase [Methanofastidiosum sp.]|nr:SET domain-containing protein-lysine N-methyltransferase [Methanofastidiosum sp.]
MKELINQGENKVEVEPIFQTFDFEIIRTAEKGKCIIANRNFRIGDTLFINNYLKIPKYEVEGKGLTNHYFWSHLGKTDDNAHIVFGLGSFLNHSVRPNTLLEWDIEREVAIFKALREIRKGEELTIDYEEIWFENLQEEPITLKAAR